VEFYTHFSKASVKVVFKEKKSGIFFGLVLEQGWR